MSQAAQRHCSARLIEGLDRHAEAVLAACPPTAKTPARLRAVLQAHVDAFDLASNKRADYLAHVAILRAAAKSANAAAAVVKRMASLTFGDEALATLDHFGIVPDKKSGPKTVAAKLMGARKGSLTRVLRGTMGKRQRNKIKG
jgi:hypothetical protein